MAATRPRVVVSLAVRVRGRDWVSASQIRYCYDNDNLELAEEEEGEKRRKSARVARRRRRRRRRRSVGTIIELPLKLYPRLPRKLYTRRTISFANISRETCSFSGKLVKKHIADAFVVVVGLGGVGSHCASMLLRSGVRKLRVVDFDQVSLSSLNRHAVATREDVGKPKADVLRNTLRRFSRRRRLRHATRCARKKNEEMVLGE